MNTFKSFQETSNSELDKIGISYYCDKSSLLFKTIKNFKEMISHEKGIPFHHYLRKYGFFLNSKLRITNLTLPIS